jgi:hypothetical protein
VIDYNASGQRSNKLPPMHNNPAESQGMEGHVYNVQTNIGY